MRMMDEKEIFADWEAKSPNSNVSAGSRSRDISIFDASSLP
jgi:hypothetical protein